MCRELIITTLESGIKILRQRKMDDILDVVLANKTLKWLRMNKIAKIDTSRHMSLLLNTDVFTAMEIAENARNMLKFERLIERLRKDNIHHSIMTKE